jgi:hypothetical protein
MQTARNEVTATDIRKDSVLEIEVAPEPLKVTGPARVSHSDDEDEEEEEEEVVVVEDVDSDTADHDSLLHKINSAAPHRGPSAKVK